MSRIRTRPSTARPTYPARPASRGPVSASDVTPVRGPLQPAPRPLADGEIELETAYAPTVVRACEIRRVEVTPPDARGYRGRVVMNDDTRYHVPSAGLVGRQLAALGLTREDDHA